MNRFRQQFDSFLPTFRRELGAYFATPMAYVFLAVFLLSIGMFTWEAARFFDTGTADLSPFFVWHPWLYMIFLFCAFWLCFRFFCGFFYFTALLFEHLLKFFFFCFTLFFVSIFALCKCYFLR